MLPSCTINAFPFDMLRRMDNSDDLYISIKVPDRLFGIFDMNPSLFYEFLDGVHGKSCENGKPMANKLAWAHAHTWAVRSANPKLRT